MPARTTAAVAATLLVMVLAACGDARGSSGTPTSSDTSTSGSLEDDSTATTVAPALGATLDAALSVGHPGGQEWPPDTGALLAEHTVTNDGTRPVLWCSSGTSIRTASTLLTTTADRRRRPAPSAWNRRRPQAVQP